MNQSIVNDDSHTETLPSHPQISVREEDSEAPHRQRQRRKRERTRTLVERQTVSLVLCLILLGISIHRGQALIQRHRTQHQTLQRLYFQGGYTTTTWTSSSISHETCPWRRSSGSSLSRSKTLTSMRMVSDASAWSRKSVSMDTFRGDYKNKQRGRKKYQRKRIPETEKEGKRLRQQRQAQYEEIRSSADGPSIWSFDSLFPKAVWDEQSIERDLYAVKRRDWSVQRDRQVAAGQSNSDDTDVQPKLDSLAMPYENTKTEAEKRMEPISTTQAFVDGASDELTDAEAVANILEPSVAPGAKALNENATISERIASSNSSGKVNYELTRMVEDRMYGYRRGTNLYDTSLMGDGAVQFREGVRLGNPLPVNAARLNYYGKKELRNNRVEEAQEMYEMAIQIDPRDGRAYIGLSRCAERRRDFTLARKILTWGITNSVSVGPDGTPDSGANPFLLQALGCLEEKMGNLAKAEKLFIEAAKSRPSHAASWVALAQLRTVKFRQGAAAGRACFQAAERELQQAGLPPNAHVYTAWASMEYKKAGDLRKARKLYRLALTADKRCSAAWLQLGVMEAANENWEDAELCFETVLKFDQRNSRVLQAYALMESKRPNSQSRKVIDLFERALKVNPRDAGVLQPYALYVAELGDIDMARELLRQGTEVNKRHAPVWQAWGVLETRRGHPDEARRIFQEGIWACAQVTGGQSGGYKCARLWQAWGVLEAQEGDYAAARRCFSRALDADKRNIAAMTAWTLMEGEIGNYNDARILYERALKQFAPGTTEKNQLWRLYELMEQEAGNREGAQEVYERAVRESITTIEDDKSGDDIDFELMAVDAGNKDAKKRAVKGSEGRGKGDKEFEVLRWDQGSTSMKAEIWLNEGSIEGKVPKATLDKFKSKKKSPP